jgi:hypothetical protein
MTRSDPSAKIPAHSGPALEAHWDSLQRDPTAWVHFYGDKCIVLSGVTLHPFGSSSGWDNFQCALPSGASNEALGSEVSNCLLGCKLSPSPSDCGPVQPMEPKHKHSPVVYLAKARSQKDLNSNSVFARITCSRTRTIHIEAYPAAFTNGGNLNVGAYVSCGHEQIGSALRKAVAAVLNCHDNGFLKL